MRILSIDPGAERCGWAIIDSDPLSLIDSDIGKFPRPLKTSYQVYRLLLIDYWVTLGEELLAFAPDYLVNEIVPAPRGDNYGRLAQMNLAATVITTLQVLALSAKIEVNQISANTVKAKIGGHKEASKVKVRNGVYKFLPETKTKRKHNWTKVFDESDAIAVGLTYLGCDIKDINSGSKG